ncbi:hypothetical protein MalM25_01070 [Planctomycetes bacterium MalM25]|nr:hypothetical protein MalM25_01070 [Planctomycetes bacterium MalM25]
MTAETRDAGLARWVGPGLALLGVALFVASLVLPDSMLRDRSWTESRAVEYQKASAELHGLSLTADGDQEAMERLRESRIVFADLDAERQSAAGTAGARRAALRWSGLGLAILGALVARRGRA